MRLVMVKKSKAQTEREEQIYQLSTLVAGELSLQEVLDKLAEAAVKIAEVKACAIRLLDEEDGDLKMRSTYGLGEEYRNKGVVSKNDPVIKAALDGEAVVLDNMLVDSRVRYPEAARKEGLINQLTVAMKFRRKEIGVLRLYNPKKKYFDEDDVRLARAVSSQCAAAIMNTKLYRRAVEGARIAEQVRLAGIIQRRMIPEKAPVINGLDIAATYIPCFDVGGDFYDFLQAGSGSVVVAVADVMGKGMPAAMMMSLFRGALRAYTNTKASSESVSKMVKKLNKLACRECRDGEFITMFYAVVNVDDMTVTYCSCGHEPTLLLRDGKTMDLDKGGLVLGVEPDVDYQVERVELRDGDWLMFYTDGLIDAVNFDNELWGRERMVQTAKKFTSGSAEQMVSNLLGYRRRFTGLAKQVDDTSIVAVKINR